MDQRPQFGMVSWIITRARGARNPKCANRCITLGADMTCYSGQLKPVKSQVAQDRRPPYEETTMDSERQTASGDGSKSDEELMRQVGARQQAALAPLYSRYAPLIFHMAAQSLGTAAADD